ncbi:hypothetical protein ABFS83_07G073200 [Erythranthe nasuta]
MGQLHIAFVPAMAHGHMIPTLEMAKLFSSRGLETTIIATPAFADPITRARESGHDRINLRILKFPPQGSSLPDDIVSLDQMSTPDLVHKFVEALSLLRQPVEKLLQELNPDCLVSDMFLPWTAASAAKFGIPRLVFHGTNCLAQCGLYQMQLHKPYKNVSSDSEPFAVPNLPHKLIFTGSQVPEFGLPEEELKDEENDFSFSKLRQQMEVSEKKSYGVIFNSFTEIESAYADHYKNVMGRKAWHIGPLLLCSSNNNNNNNNGRGEEKSHGSLLAWLDSKKPHSVVYVCFGSIVTFTPVQLHETAAGLEASGQDFIWVVRNGDEKWLPQGFEERTKCNGLIIKGWAPQVTILDHPSVGAFVTHCGWNSTLEGICAGLPMVTWPVFSEQFFNEKLLVDVLGIGVSVGSKKWTREPSEGVSREAVIKAVHRIMVGREAAELRSRAQGYKEMATKAFQQGGSSYTALTDLIHELSMIYAPPKKQDTTS